MKAKTNNPPEISDYEGGVTLPRFLSMLDGVRKAGPGFIAKCPSHEDKSASLSVSQGDKGILVWCHAGCSYPEIVAALDLRPQDLFADALTQDKKDEYIYRGLISKVMRLETRCYFLENDMNKGLLNEMEMQGYRETIQTLINYRNERDSLKRQYGYD